MEILQVIDVVPTPDGWWIGLWRVREGTRWAIELHEDKTPVGGTSPFQIGDVYEYESANGDGELRQIDPASLAADLQRKLPVAGRVAIRKAREPARARPTYEVSKAPLNDGAGVAHRRQTGGHLYN